MVLDYYELYSFFDGLRAFLKHQVSNELLLKMVFRFHSSPQQSQVRIEKCYEVEGLLSWSIIDIEGFELAWVFLDADSLVHA